MSSRAYRFTDYLSSLLVWKKLILIVLIIVGIITIGITYLIPEKFKSSSTIIIAEDSGGLGAVGNMLGNVNSIFGGLLGGSGISAVDKSFGYLESRLLLDQVISKFNLEDYYGFSKFKYERTLKALREDLSFDLTENGFVNISMIHKSPNTAADIVNFVSTKLDSINKTFSLTNAKNYRQFIEKRYLKNIEDLHKIQEKLKDFQKQYNLYVIPEQIEIAFQSLAQIESELTLKELNLQFVENQRGKDNPDYLALKSDVDNFKIKLDEIRQGQNSKYNSILGIASNKLPEIYKEYFELYREMEIQSKLMEFIVPVYEQAMMEEQKNIPTVTVLDEAIPSEMKYSPKKAFIVLTIEILLFFFLAFLVIRFESSVNLTDKINPNKIDLAERRIALKLKKVFKIA